MLLRKETFFRLNRILLLSAVIFSAIIPAIQLPKSIQPAAQNEWIPAIKEMETTLVSQPISEEAVQAITVPIEQPNSVLKKEFPWLKLIKNTYLAGILISFLILIYGIVSILVLFRKARFMQMDGFRLLIIDHEIPPFSFGHFVIISQADYDAHQQTILAHEEAHIRLNHFFDLAVLETVKLFHWFNPAMYWLIRDMKEIHEFQADQYTLQKGIDATQYQILIIQKSVGTQRFALANSFNHCQIKKRIIMMNNQKTSKARLWKVATFLPLLAVLLMAFSKTGENVPPEQQKQEKQWTEADFGKPFYDPKVQSRAFTGIQIKINSDSEIILHREIATPDAITNEAKKYFDYSLADESMKKEFERITINGQDGMAQRFNLLYVLKDLSASPEVVQNLLNSIGKAAQETRQKYASQIFKTDYGKLAITQKSEIDKLVPAIIVVQSYPILSQKTMGNQPPPPPSDKPVPLYVVDGMILEGNPNIKMLDGDIQSISSLNSKSATEMFGEKGKNGAVIITTKIIGADARNSRYIKNQTIEPQKNKDGVFVTSEEMPQFPGGSIALRRFIAEKVKYPIEAQKDNIQGKVYVSFVVNSKGKVEKAKITKGVRDDLDAEAIRVVSLLPDWTPGKNKGEAVDVAYTVPIQFGLQSNESTAGKINNTVFLVVDEMPRFPGGETELMKFIASNMKYPEQAKTDKAQGEVMVNFVVRSDGKIENPKIIKRVHPALDAEAIRIVKILPDWRPGKQDGKTVDVSYTVPVKFNL
jgi:TonB family protein